MIGVPCCLSLTANKEWRRETHWHGNSSSWRSHLAANNRNSHSRLWPTQTGSSYIRSPIINRDIFCDFLPLVNQNTHKLRHNCEFEPSVNVQILTHWIGDRMWCTPINIRAVCWPSLIANIAWSELPMWDLMSLSYALMLQSHIKQQGLTLASLTRDFLSTVNQGAHKLRRS